MNFMFSPAAWDDYLYSQAADPKMVSRINQLLKDTAHNPYTGIGKPEPLRHALKGYWSRRIDAEHRLVYRITDGAIFIAQLRFHYS